VSASTASAFGMLKAAAAIGTSNLDERFDSQIDTRMAKSASAAITIDAAFLHVYHLLLV